MERSSNTKGFTQHYKNSTGFTLIEILVAISIIGILSAIILSSFNMARNKGADAKRATDLSSIQAALEGYYNHNAYQYPNPGWGWRSQCVAWGGYAANNVIPGLVPTYLPVMPVDSQMDAAGNLCCYLYLSNGADYALLAHNCPTSNICYGPGEATGGFADPVRPTWSCKVSSPGGAQW
jgi:prepilin-type N-terminal cleavage/methylation domain-containing protein